jgi:uncharacterized protein
MTENLDSPCIKICQLDEAAICLGCYRSAAEIGAWWQADPLTRQTILVSAKQRQLDYAERRRNKRTSTSQTINK